MRGVYNITQEGVALGTSIVTLIEIESGATTPSFFVTRAWIDNEDSESSQQIAVSLVRKSVDGTNVTTPNERELDEGSAASGLTLRGMCTTVGTISATIMRRGFNVLNNWEWIATERGKIYVPPGGVFGLHIPVAPATCTISAGVEVEVIG